MPNSSPQIALSLENITKTFSVGTEALAPTSLELSNGEFVALVGPSGCGKSTLLRIAARLMEPTSGTVSGTASRDHSKFGFVFQDPTLMPWATVLENVALPLHLNHSSKKDAADRSTRVLEWVGLSDFAHAYPRELSGGMKMRASIARALVQQPELLLLDEPFAALDEFTRAQLNDDLLRLWEEQKWTALFVTHSIREAAFLSSRVIVMSPRPGRVVANLSVPFDHPRTSALRNGHPFTDFCADVSQHFAQAMSGAT